MWHLLMYLRDVQDAAGFVCTQFQQRTAALSHSLCVCHLRSQAVVFTLSQKWSREHLSVCHILPIQQLEHKTKFSLVVLKIVPKLILIGLS